MPEAAPAKGGTGLNRGHPDDCFIGRHRRDSELRQEFKQVRQQRTGARRIHLRRCDYRWHDQR